METKKIIKILQDIQPEGFNWSNPTESEMIKFEAIFKAGYHQRELDPLDKEDRCEKCYQQGKNEVVGWIREYSHLHYSSNQEELLFIPKNNWQVKLREWGIE